MNWIHSRSRRRAGRTLFAAVTLGTVTLGAVGLLVAPSAGAAASVLPYIRPLNLAPGVSTVLGINNRGEVILQGEQNAFRWTRSNGLQYLVGPGGRLDYAADINDHGQVAGGGLTNDGIGAHAKVWTPSTGVRDLGVLGGLVSHSVAINESGMVAGQSSTETDPRNLDHAFRWTPTGGMQDLGSLATRINSRTSVVGINDRGDVAGDASTLTSTHAFVWTQAKGIKDLGVLPGEGDYSLTAGINNCGWVAGSSWLARGRFHAFLWTPATGMQDLGTLPGGDYSVAVAINSRGQVTGNASTATGATHAFLWTPGIGMKDLGTIHQGDTWAAGLNDRGDVTGTLQFTQHAFLWTSADGMRDLGTLGGYGTKSYAQAINNSDQVIGNAGMIGNSDFHATLWTPPRPGV